MIQYNVQYISAIVFWQDLPLNSKTLRSCVLYSQNLYLNLHSGLLGPRVVLNDVTNNSLT